MPYAIKKQGDNYVVVNTQTKKVKGTHATMEKAKRQLNLLRGIKHSSWRPTKK